MKLRFKPVLRITGLMFCISAAVMLVPLLSCIYWQDWNVFRSFLKTIIICLFSGLALLFACRKKRRNSSRSSGFLQKGAVSGDFNGKGHLSLRESILTLFFVWVTVSVSTSLPYLFSNAHTLWTDALFESVSALTTTGATAFASTSALPMPLIFWRSFCQWLGGMGVLVMLSSLLRKMGGSGNMLKLENPGLVMSENEARYTELARRLVISYCVLSVLQVVVLMAGGLGPFASVVLTFSTVSTGGATYFSDSVLHFHSLFVEVVVAVFMLLAALNLGLWTRLFHRDFKRIRRDSELKAFGAIVAVCSLAVSLNLYCSGAFASLAQSFRYGIFHVISFITTAGMYSCDCSGWPAFTRMILTLLTFIGGCSMSTTGALKVFRLILLCRLVRRSFTMRLHPQAVETIKINGRPVHNTMLNSTIAFVFTYLAAFLLGIFVISFEAPDLQTAFTGSAALLNNMGAGFGAMGMAGNYSAYSPFMKFFMCLLMLAGRLELYAVLLPFTPEFRKEQ